MIKGVQRFIGHLFLAAMAGMSGTLYPESPRPPNVLFIIADDLRLEQEAAGGPRAVTPNLERLATRGLTWLNAYCQQAVCNPSRSSLMTGLRPDTLRVWDLKARFRETCPEAVTIPEWFKKHGYHTEGIGKIFHNETRLQADRVPMSDPVSWTVPPVLASGSHWRDWVVPGHPEGPERKMESWQSLDVPDEAYLDGRIAKSACEAIERLASSEQPFFLAVGFWKPHLPFNAPRKYWEMYEPESFAGLQPEKFPEGAPSIAGHNWKELRNYQGIPKTGPLSQDLTLQLRQGYFACVSFLDEQVGKVLDQLAHYGLEENTVVVFTSDHGFHLGEHELWCKKSNYELDARVPLIMAGPGIEQHGSKTRALTELLDLFPTLAGLAGLPVPANLEGESLQPVLGDPSLPGKAHAMSQHQHPFHTDDWVAMGYAARTARYRYVEWVDRSGKEVIGYELYDHACDPLESQNLFGDPQYAEAVRELAAIIEKARLPATPESGR
jgi:iduronate 2-sulfatase